MCGWVSGCGVLTLLHVVYFLHFRTLEVHKDRVSGGRGGGQGEWRVGWGRG